VNFIARIRENAITIGGNVWGINKALDACSDGFKRVALVGQPMKNPWLFARIPI
jgi:hypothetical protein